VAHPVNPPHLVPIVELCPAPWTAKKTVDAARRIYEDIGQVPILVKKEIEGFILNRLQGALLAEAFRLIGAGYVSTADLERQIGVFVEHYNHCRYHESIGNLTPADVYLGRGAAILERREAIKRKSIAHRRLLHRQANA
jgi:hypothetical protein